MNGEVSEAGGVLKFVLITYISHAFRSLPFIPRLPTYYHQVRRHSLSMSAFYPEFISALLHDLRLFLSYLRFYLPTFIRSFTHVIPAYSGYPPAISRLHSGPDAVPSPPLILLYCPLVPYGPWLCLVVLGCIYRQPAAQSEPQLFTLCCRCAPSCLHLFSCLLCAVERPWPVPS